MSTSIILRVYWKDKPLPSLGEIWGTENPGGDGPAEEPTISKSEELLDHHKKSIEELHYRTISRKCFEESETSKNDN